jgi:antitoxin (DNA-binding transcriptional repressor) of toxin-antitoxin stability system
VKTISIKQLHAETGRWVRAAKKQTIVVTDRGEEIAELRPLATPTQPRAVLDPVQRLAWMPVSKADSTVFISEDRDGR